MSRRDTVARPVPQHATHLLEDLLTRASDMRASDIHIEPTADAVRVRVRVDGILSSLDPIALTAHPELVSRVKVLAGLRTDEHRRPQDGRFQHEDMDVRVATVPTYFGEKVVLRLLSASGEAVSLTSLGMGERDRKVIQRALAHSHGLILAAGPTGSGKTSTLYALLTLLMTEQRSIVTIEDPVEYAIPAITQIQTDERAGLSFESGLRSVLRLDPDTIMVGEIRDRETAQLAVNAALTGHTVLSSVHTNDAPTTLPRLIDLGIEPYLLPSTVRLIIAQRLVRRLCTGCYTMRALHPQEREILRVVAEREGSDIPREHGVGAGCAACSGSGYRGRIGVFELLRVDEGLRELILSCAAAPTIHDYARKRGMRTLLADGFEKAAAGLTSLEEIVRLSHE